MIKGLPEDWEKQRLQSWRAQTKFSTHQYPKERSSDPQEMDPKLPASYGGSPVGVWVGRDSPQGHRHWKLPLGINPPGVHH